MNRLVNKLNRKIPWLCVPNLMLYIVIGMCVTYMGDMLFPDYAISAKLELIPFLVAQGEVWRLITFIFVAPSTANLLLTALCVYFFYYIGTELENSWGSFGFTLYYFIGIIGTILSALITGYASNTYLNLSLFFAYAILYPDDTFMIFFIIPVKAKYLAIADAILFVIRFIFGTWSVRLAIIASLLNLLAFFGGDLICRFRNNRRYSETRRNFRRETRNSNNRYC